MRIRNAFNPLIWLVGTTGTIFSAVTASGAPAWAIGLAGALLAASVAVALFAYLWFMFKDPDRLHSEDYQIQKNMLQLTMGRGQSPYVEQTPLTSNPEIQIERAE